MQNQGPNEKANETTTVLHNVDYQSIEAILADASRLVTVTVVPDDFKAIDEIVADASRLKTISILGIDKYHPLLE
jgi:hypothetical protein